MDATAIKTLIEENVSSNVFAVWFLAGAALCSLVFGRCGTGILDAGRICNG